MYVVAGLRSSIRQPTVTIILFALFATGCELKPRESAMPSPDFSLFVDEYFDHLSDWVPSWATASGFHQYDARIEDLSAAAYNRRLETVKKLQARLAELRKNRLDEDDSIDAEFIDSQMSAELLELQSPHGSRTNPMTYVGLPGEAIDILMKRNFAPESDRLRSVIARLKGIPALMDALKANVMNPPKEFTDLALRIANGSVGFFDSTVASWAKNAAGGNTALESEFAAANAVATKSLRDAAAWIETSLLPRSNGNYAIGTEHFSKKLFFEEMVDTPLDQLLAAGEANLEKDYKAFVETARQIDPDKTPHEVMQSVSDEHPTEQSLISDAREMVEEIVQFIKEKKIVTIPSDVRPTIMETPAYARSGVFASMDTPGAFETKATEAFYYVTPPEFEWDAKHKEEHLRLFNAPVMKIITVHEAYPGHYIQFLYAKQFPTKTRQLLAVNSNAEGWAHYAEQMMIDEGYGAGDPRLRLAQLSEALLRDARYIVGIKLHTDGWTVEQGARFFEEKAFQEPSVAFEEARRGAYNPTYLYYTLGKLEIYRLRDDFKKARGAAYTLENFHNEYVTQGSVPIKLIRRILLQDRVTELTTCAFRYDQERISMTLSCILS
jgi:uncharacterized protein (DUF885 family)